MKNIFSRVLIKDKENNILVIRDRKSMWNFPGGKLEIGETPLDCAKREVKEEIGLQVNNLVEIFKGDFCFNGVTWRGHFYFANSAHGIPALNELGKIKGIQFIDNLSSVNFAPELSPVINQFSTTAFKTRITSWE